MVVTLCVSKFSAKHCCVSSRDAGHEAGTELLPVEPAAGLGPGALLTDPRGKGGYGTGKNLALKKTTTLNPPTTLSSRGWGALARWKGPAWSGSGSRRSAPGCRWGQRGGFEGGEVGSGTFFYTVPL